MLLRSLFFRHSLGVAILSAAVFILAVGFWPAVESQSARSVTLTVHVTGARNVKGKIRAALFESANGFPNDASQAIQRQSADIDPRSLRAQIVFPDLREGVYAVAVFHDENMNQQLDKNLFGVPKEGYGASNNPKKKMGPPGFGEAKFQLNEQAQTVEIKLMY
jgi:uncharacterized protein (DUF2141 family)